MQTAQIIGILKVFALSLVITAVSAGAASSFRPAPADSAEVIASTIVAPPVN